MPSGRQPEAGQLARAISAKVQMIMDDERISVSRLAAAAGLSRNYLGKRLRNEASLTLNDIEAICKALGENLPSFLAGAIGSMGE
ncbi:helix-turn-helix transcriptional regulator [Arthrobacter sp. GMC3]|uniref:helix-turn-helix domain-containing protein n=1 Tax=Arthrobacter sp. GMC3 TaxID=2058894 RepID=UPI0015E48C4C|nr:helix-turn-helix transcriptional regulator [Arthrobacter sp. GMC3]